MDSVASISEVLMWVGLLGAIPFAVLGASLRLVRGPWESAPAELSDGQLRWMSSSGTFHRSTPWPTVPETDELVVHYRRRQPHVAHPEPVAHDERALRLVALLLAGVAIATLVIGSIAQLL